jgi:hypothetical protein
MSRFLDLINGKPASVEIPTPKKVKVKKTPTYTTLKRNAK